MLRKIAKHWLMFVFLIIISMGCILTLVFNAKGIGASTYKNIRGEICENGIRLKMVSSSISIAENAFTDNLYAKNYWIEVLGLFNKTCSKKIFLDTEDRYTVYKMSNGQETWNYSGYNTDEFVNNYRVFAEDMKERDIPLLYVQAPFKINKYNNELPYGISDETNPLADNFLQGISDYNTIDLRDVIYEEGMDYDSLFYKTDHHWNSKTGLWASGIVAEELVDRYGLDIDTSFLSDENYKFTDYSNYMLGSQGKRAGIVYSGLDDFVLIEPIYDTNYQLQIPALNIVKEGNYSNTILFKENLKKDYYNGDPGRVYTGDNYSLMTIKNLNATNSTKILLIKDSFSKSVVPFLASTCKELHAIDLRTFDGSVSEYALENGIDAVVVLYNPSVVVDSNFFEFY